MRPMNILGKFSLQCHTDFDESKYVNANRRERRKDDSKKVEENERKSECEFGFEVDVLFWQ